MAYDPQKHHRRSIRMPRYDYATPGRSFVTVCTQDRLCLLGEIDHDHVLTNPIGRMIDQWWRELPNKFAVSLDLSVVMPNHFHGIVETHEDPDAPQNEDGVQLGPSLPAILQWFKTMSTNEYYRGVKEHNWPRVRERLWQRDYYEHVVRSEDDLDRIREYIQFNPINWHLDPENAHAQPRDGDRTKKPWEV